MSDLMSTSGTQSSASSGGPIATHWQDNPTISKPDYNPEARVYDQHHNNGTPLTMQELLNLCADDYEFYCRYFFPKVVRQGSPEFHRKIWAALENPQHRNVNVQVFRGGAKTTLLRLFTSRRIAFSASRTIMYIGKSEKHAVRSVRWIKSQVEKNTKWAQTFGLRKGKTWTDTEVLIEHGGDDDQPIWILAMGITGAVRGVLPDDFRPDLIILDDVISDENAATLEQREKIEDLIYGAVKESLAPASECPDATLAMLQTPLHREDASMKALTDMEWISFVYSVFGEDGQSAWPQRWSTETLMFEKEAAVKRNRHSVWLREKECKIVDEESSAFLAKWLQFYDTPPEYGTTVIAVDPVPPPTETQIAKGLHKKDYEAFAVVRRFKDNYFILEISSNRGHEPTWTITEFFRLCKKYRPRCVVVETVAYQKTLEWLLKEEMRKRRQYYVIEENDDKRSKYDKIVDPLQTPAHFGQLWAHHTMTTFVSQFNEYPGVSHDDELEAVAVAVQRLSREVNIEGDYETIEDEEENIPDLEPRLAAP